jgi:hypothetical protein
MANDRSSVKTRRGGGWNAVEEQAPAPAQEIVAGTSASEVPKSTLTIDGIREIVRRVIGTLPYEGMPDLIGLSTEKKNLIIEGIVHGCELSLSVSEIQSIIDQLKRLGADTSFPGLIQIAERYRQVTGELLDRLNRLGAPQ